MVKDRTDLFPIKIGHPHRTKKSEHYPIFAYVILILIVMLLLDAMYQYKDSFSFLTNFTALMFNIAFFMAAVYLISYAFRNPIKYAEIHPDHVRIKYIRLIGIEAENNYKKVPIRQYTNITLLPTNIFDEGNISKTIKIIFYHPDRKKRLYLNKDGNMNLKHKEALDLATKLSEKLNLPLETTYIKL